MYNGIGLKSVRGSSTNGFVRKNTSYIKPSWVRKRAHGEEEKKSKIRKIDPEIIEHNRKRRIEVRLCEERIRMEDRNVPESKIEVEIKALRTKWQQEYEEEQTKMREIKTTEEDGEIKEGMESSAKVDEK